MRELPRAPRPAGEEQSVPIKINKKKILIVWCLIHLFALIVNLVPIQGKFQVHCGYSENMRCDEYVFTSRSYEDDGQFWPFVDMYHETDYSGYAPLFKGIFFSYNIKAFIVYILVGFALVYVPALWKKQSIIENL